MSPRAPAPINMALHVSTVPGCLLDPAPGPRAAACHVHSFAVCGIYTLCLAGFDVPILARSSCLRVWHSGKRRK